MSLLWVVALSSLIQLIAAVLALRLMFVTKHRLAWGLLSTALFLMAVRRIISFYHILNLNPHLTMDAPQEWIGLALSICMLAAILLIKPLFSEIKRSEEDMRASKEEYKFLFDTMSQGVNVQDTKGLIIEANAASARILGLSMGQLMGKTPYDPRWKMINEDGSPLSMDDVPSNIALRTGKPSPDVVMGVFIPEKKAYRWIMVDSTPRFRNGETKPFCTFTTFVDISKRVETEARVLEQSSLLKAFLESSDNPLFAVDGAYRYTTFNKAHAAVMKAIYGSDIAVGRSLLECMTVDEDRAIAKANIDQAMTGRN